MEFHADSAPDDGARSAPPERPRLRAAGGPPSASSAQSRRAADQLARLEARIREFHFNLDTLDGVESDADHGGAPVQRIDAAADSLVTRAAAAARAAAAGPDATRTGADHNGRSERYERPDLNGSSDHSSASDAQTASDGDADRRRRRSDRADGPFTAQRRIDALRPGARAADEMSQPPASVTASALGARAHADQIQQEAKRRSDRLHQNAAHEAAQMRRDAEQEMQELWQALEAEVEAIQTEISRRVDGLTERMDTVGREADHIRASAIHETQRLRADALAAATEIRDLASQDAEALLSLAEREAHALIAAARTQAETLLTPVPEAIPVPERSAAERIAEQIRDATAALTRRVSRGVEDPPTPAREVREAHGSGPIPSSFREVRDGLALAVSLIERSLTGLADLLGDALAREDD